MKNLPQTDATVPATDPATAVSGKDPPQYLEFSFPVDEQLYPEP